MTKILRLIFACGFLLCLIACNSDGPAYTIEPPFKSIAPQYDTFELDASEAKMLRLTSGSSIEIPENAFVDKHGNVVKGKVALKYREFHTAADILASGIPMMSNDENGEAKAFESGGMFEIAATANGEEIRIAKDKKIHVNLASKVEGDFDFYYLEEDGSKKVETASLFLQTQSCAATNKKYRWKKLNTASEDTAKNSSERKKNPNAKYFQAHFDTKKYSEAAAIDTIKWEYAGIAKTEDPTDPSNASFKNTTWKSVSVTQPVYYTEQVSKINPFKGTNNRHQGLISMLPDSLGFLAEDGIDYVSFYGWDGNLKARYKETQRVDASTESWVSGNSDFVNKQHSHILLKDKNNHCKLFLLNGTLVKDLGVLHKAFFNKTGDKIIGQAGLAHDKFESAISVFSLQGTLIHKATFDQDESMYSNYFNWDLSEDHSIISTLQQNKLTVIDTDGKVLATTASDNVYSWNFLKYNQAIVCYTDDNKVTVWDWKKNKSIKSKHIPGGYMHDVHAHPSQPLLLIHIGKRDYIWNWEKDTYKEIAVSTGEYGHMYFSPKGDFIYPDVWNSNELKSTELLKSDGSVVFKPATSKMYQFLFNKNEDGIIVFRDTSECFLIDKTGKVLRDFKKYDPEINRVVFCDNGDILSCTENGVVTVWDKKGILLHTLQTNKAGCFLYPGHNGFIYLYSREESVEVWNYNTKQLMYTFNSLFVFDSNAGNFPENYVKIPDWAALSWGYGSKYTCTLWKKTSTKLTSDTYRLSFKNDSLEFHTYVYLNAEQLILIHQYQQAIQDRINTENKRVKEENKLLRSFAINNFGIYNWDRFYKDTNAVFVTATMELDTTITEFNHITFFLITGKDRNVVIKYYEGTLDKFRFVPEDNNILLAVLPNDRIAIFEEEKFRQLDIAELKKKAAYTFKLKIIAGEASKAVLDQILKKPAI